ncbi:hypothetical protein GCM10022234_25670 [Aeromicrobium panaciterrae]|uniref:hypothetical protein n=1 Tax=Aeromicrobium panaciterrae TaxID=363861 RepID=UPI0031D48CBC
MTRGLAAGLLLLLGLLIAAPTGAAGRPVARTIDEMVAQLRTDPVLVQPVMGTGDAHVAHDMLAGLAERVDAPVYVVLGALPAELDGAEHPAEQAAALLRQELGDGLYIIKFDEGIDYARGFGKAASLDLNLGYRAIRAAEEEGPEEYNRTTAVFDAAALLRAAAEPGQPISDRTLRKLMDEPWAFIATESNEHADQVARRWVYAIAAGLAVAIAGLTLSRVAVGAPMAARRAPDHSPGAPEPPDLADTERVLDQAQHRFDALSAAQLGSASAHSADEALRAARTVVGSRKDLDVVGARVLALIAGRELDRIDKPSLAAYRPCVVNPLHGEASETIQLSGTALDAPVCRACARQPGDFLRARTWRGSRPYLDTDTVWASTGFGALVDDLASQVLQCQGGRG